MRTITVKLRNPGFSDSRTYLFALAFVVGNVVFPQLCHLVAMGGLRWLPIYFFTLVGAYRYGWRVGVLTALASPIVNSALFGMPALAMLPLILMKSTLLAIVAAAASRLFPRSLGAGSGSLPQLFLAIAMTVVAYQGVGAIGEWLMGNSWYDAFQDMRIGFPGLIVQLLFAPLVIRLLPPFERH